MRQSVAETSESRDGIPRALELKYGWPIVSLVAYADSTFPIFSANKVRVANYVGGSKKGMAACIDLRNLRNTLVFFREEINCITQSRAYCHSC
jgi:hypothetical protein